MGSVGCVARGGVATTSQCVTRRTRGGDGARARSRATARTQNAPRFGGVTTRRHENGLRVTVTGNDRDRKWHRVHASADELSGLDEDGITDTTKLDRLTERDTPNTFVTKTDEVSAIAIVSDAEVSRTKTIDPEVLDTSEETPVGWSLDPFPGSFQELAQKWQTLPSRYRVILGTTAAFVLCNMDKVNISVAIIPMAKEMGWSVGQAGLLQSAFFYGFALSQLPGGYLATRFGGARMLPIGVFLWSAATCAVPFCANDPTLLFASRVLVGLGEGVSPAAAVDVIARSVPAQERSRAVAFVFNGFNIGSVLGLSLAPAIIENFGWRSVFVTFGGLGVFWVAWVGLGVYQRGGAMPGATRDNAPKELAPVRGLTGRRPKEVGGTENENTDELSDEKDEENKPVPWGEILSCTPVRALAYVHFCNNWGFYVLLAWLPSYFTQELGVTLTNASLFTLCPPLANIAVASFVGPLADDALKKGMDVTRVRKTAQTIALCGPATFMAAASLVSYNGDDGAASSGFATVALLTLGLSLSSFSYAGLYCNHQDLSPRYASILLGLTNTIGALPGVIGVPLTGYLLQRTENWELSMFLPAILLYFSGAAVFAKWGDAEKQSWG